MFSRSLGLELGFTSSFILLTLLLIQLDYSLLPDFSLLKIFYSSGNSFPKSLAPDQWFSIRGNLIPRGHLPQGNDGPHFLIVTTRKKVLWHLVSWGQGCCLTSYSVKDSSHSKEWCGLKYQLPKLRYFALKLISLFPMLIEASRVLPYFSFLCPQESHLVKLPLWTTSHRNA